MRFRLGLVIGFGSGYYLGAKAGRQRYEQMRNFIDRARNSDLAETAADKARAVVDLGMERARDLVERGDERDEEPAAVTVDVDLRGNGRSG